jgi:serine/threonine protein kinase
MRVSVVNSLQVAAHKHVTVIKDVIWDCVLPNKHGEGHKDTVMIGMELAEGGELFDYLMYTGPFSEAIVKIFFRQLLSGGSSLCPYCHAACLPSMQSMHG